MGETLREGATELKKHILFVDDAPLVLDSLRRMLRGQRGVWEMTFCHAPETAWELLQDRNFDAAVVDVKMPGIDGLQLLDRMQSTETTKHIPVVMLTGLLDRALKHEALNLGATDLLNKPVEPEDLLARLQNALRLKAYQDELQASNDLLEQHVAERTEELFHSRMDIVWRLAKAAEHRDTETGNHVIRVGCYSRAIAEELGMKLPFIKNLLLAAPLHDIGKIGIPDSILLRRGPLSGAQRARMERHCVIGERILREDSKMRAALEQWRGTSSKSVSGDFDNPLLEMAASIALTHHEKWDGTGYPRGLANGKIPLESRIVAISDVFDAVTSKRPYKQPQTEEQALQILRNTAVGHFDPEVYAAFLKALPEIRAIRRQFADDGEPPLEPEEAREEEGVLQ